MPIGNSAISVCVPISISDSSQIQYVIELFESISIQTFKDFDLVVSDDSENEEVYKLCLALNSDQFPIKYVASQSKGISLNLNNAVLNSTGNFVKIMFQDDFFFSKYALAEIYAALNDNNKSWYVSACNHFSQLHLKFYEDFFPSKNSKMLSGHNSISSPSVVTFRRDVFENFSNRLTYLLDCEWYVRMSHKHGLPIFGKLIHISNRIHPSQATHWAKHSLDREILICSLMHSAKGMGSKVCSCL